MDVKQELGAGGTQPTALLGARSNPEGGEPASLAPHPGTGPANGQPAGDAGTSSAAPTGLVAECANIEGSVSIWSSSNSDSDDLHDKLGHEAGRSNRREHKSKGRRLRSPGSNPLRADSSASEDRKEYEGDRDRPRRQRSRSIDDADPRGDQTGPPHAEDFDGENDRYQHHRARSQDSNESQNDDRDGQDRYDGRRRGPGGYRRDSFNQGGYSRGGPGASHRKGPGKRSDGYYNSKGFLIPPMSKPLVSFQQFSSLQTRQSDVKSISHQFKLYKKEHWEKHAQAFWEEHEKEPWFMEQYNPMTIYQIRQDQQEMVQAKAVKFFDSIPLALLDLQRRPDMTAAEIASGPQTYRFDPNERTLYLKQVPVFVARAHLKEAVNSVTKGLEQVIFSQPLRMHNFERFAWLVYETEELAEAAIPDLDTLNIRAPEIYQTSDFKLSPVRNNQSVKPPKITPEMAADHLPRDFALCKRLIQEVFDVSKQVEFPFEKLDREVESLDVKFDTLLLYMRRIHGYCFFCGIKCDDERALAGKCASAHLRMPPTVDRALFDSSALYGSAKQFESNYLQQAEAILMQGPEEKTADPQEDELLVDMKNEYCLKKTREVQEGRKYVCVLCEKAFRSTEFVVKHIKNKHEERLERLNYSYFKSQARDNFRTELNKTTSQYQAGPSFNSERQGEGGYQGHHGGQGYRGRGDFRGRGGYHGGRRDYTGQNSFQTAEGEGQQASVDPERRQGAQQRPPQKEYIDFDDPSQFDRDGMPVSGGQGGAQASALAQQQKFAMQQPQQTYMKKQQSFGAADRQLVSYDDLF